MKTSKDPFPIDTLGRFLKLLGYFGSLQFFKKNDLRII